ncbi:hypothetical protein [Arcticibacterium luteifluviistationis]|uniref:UspA domain-containing protein n=1 Tax=Arcticibacterium luteifluviistationis TaxID=1784714 RepID=A0A2Z4G845_9BACT|nr:hypothetical protein [Arcticibacterium luteifluviistationis]AWV97248.1 hypothetical protein DJ013_03310 [Arcticibacterium luteifluviistationis]
MKSQHRIAFCTDFSPNASTALDSLLFSIWNYNLGIDIIHLIEDNEKETLRKIDELRESLKHHEDHIGLIEFFTFKADEKHNLLDHLNSDKYIYVELGLKGKNQKKGLGDFIKSVYTKVKEDIVVVPPRRTQSIDNRIVLFLEKEHINYLYLIRRYSNFLQFNFCRLTMIFMSSEVSNQSELEAYEKQVKEIIPGLSNKVHILNKEKCGSLLLNMVKEKKQDIYVFFSNDYFNDLIFKFLEDSLTSNEFDTPFMRLSTSPERVELYKTPSGNEDRVRLKDF